MAESSASSGSVRLPEVPEKPQEAAVGQAEGVRQGCQAKGGFCASPRTCGYQAVSSGASEQHEGLTCESLTEELDIEELAKKYKTNLKKGLTGKKAAEILERDGLNELEKPPKPTLLMLFLMQLTSFIIILLMVAAVASILVNATGPNAADPLSYTTGIAIAARLQVRLQKHRIGRIAKLIAGEEPQRLAEADGGQKTTCFCFPDTSGSQTPLQQNLNKLGARIGVLAIVICVGIFIIGWVTDRKDPANPESAAWLYMILVSVTLAVAAIPEGIPLCVTISLTWPVNQEVLVRKLAAVETLGSASVICSDKTGKMTMVGMYTAGVTYDVTGKGFDPEVGQVQRSGSTANSGKDMGSSAWREEQSAGGHKLSEAILCCNTTLSKEKDEDGVMKWTPKGNSSEAPIVVAARKVGLSETIASPPTADSESSSLTVSRVKGAEICPGGMPLPAGTNYLAVCKGVRALSSFPGFGTDMSGKSGMPGVAKLTEDDKKERYCSSLGPSLEILQIVDGTSPSRSKTLRLEPNLPHLLLLREHLPPSSQNLQQASREKRYDENNEDASRIGSNFIDVELISTDQKFEACRKQLRLIGLVASIDPERDGVPDSVLAARGAGIRVVLLSCNKILPVMITGDYLLTAIAIAKNVNILQPCDDPDVSAVDCACLRPDGEYLDNKEMDKLTGSVRVFARAKPEDKLEIVKSIQRQGQVAAMTGVNDAPALNQADIGVAMGIQGTEARQARCSFLQDMELRILTDDNFCSIVVEKGRAIYAGIQKFVAFIMSVHIAEACAARTCIGDFTMRVRTPLKVMQIFICIVVGIPVMRTPLQILFLILVTDLPPSIALGVEPGEANILKMRPRPKDEPIVLNWMWLAMIMNGMVLTDPRLQGPCQYVHATVIVAVYLISLMHFCEGEILQANIYLLEGYETKLLSCTRLAMQPDRRQVQSENIRAYISRSFTNPMWHDILGNKASLLRTSVPAATELQFQEVYIMSTDVEDSGKRSSPKAVLIPYLSDKILGLRGLEIGRLLRWEDLVAEVLGAVAAKAVIGRAVEVSLVGLWQSLAQWVASSSRKAASSLVGAAGAYQARKYQESLAISDASETRKSPLTRKGTAAVKPAKSAAAAPEGRCCWGWFW
ncbi:yloB [Symbiodinium sp. CCMP2456]|nr:yloB [Symbiodinium sp. CCMP2456]